MQDLGLISKVSETQKPVLGSIFSQNNDSLTIKSSELNQKSMFELSLYRQLRYDALTKMMMTVEEKFNIDSKQVDLLIRMPDFPVSKGYI